MVNGNPTGSWNMHHRCVSSCNPDDGASSYSSLGFGWMDVTIGEGELGDPAKGQGTIPHESGHSLYGLPDEYVFQQYGDGSAGYGQCESSGKICSIKDMDDSDVVTTSCDPMERCISVGMCNGGSDDGKRCLDNAKGHPDPETAIPFVTETDGDVVTANVRLYDNDEKGRYRAALPAAASDTPGIYSVVLRFEGLSTAVRDGQGELISNNLEMLAEPQVYVVRGDPPVFDPESPGLPATMGTGSQHLDLALHVEGLIIDPNVEIILPGAEVSNIRIEHLNWPTNGDPFETEILFDVDVSDDAPLGETEFMFRNYGDRRRGLRDHLRSARDPSLRELERCVL